MSYTISDFMKGRIQQQRQPAPLLQFYELPLPDGTYIRVVDFWDPRNEGTLPKTVSFNGADFSSVPVQRTEIKESSLGSREQFSLTIADPTHVVASLLWKHRGLSGSRVTMWIAAQDNLSVVADAWKSTFLITSASVSQGPDAVVFVLGFWNLYEERYPKLFYDRNRCFNSYHDRFVVGNHCSYPSNEFGPNKAQDLLAGAELIEKKRKYGWYTQQASRASVFSAHNALNGHLRIRTVDQVVAWEGHSRYGPYFYRPLEGDVDVLTYIPNQLASRPGWTVGLLLQDLAAAAKDIEPGEDPPPTPVSSWIFWAMEDNGAGGFRLAAKVTSNSVTTKTVYAFTDKELRLKRIIATDTIELYSRANGTVPWTLRHTAVMSLPSPARIGVAICSDTTAPTEFGADFDYIRFTNGGKTKCTQNKQGTDGCLDHDNVIDFNGFEEIPDDRQRY